MTVTHADDVHAEERALAHLLDSAFRVPGTNWRFGLDGLLGLVPGIGDAAGLVLSSGVIVRAVSKGARGATVVRMVGNVAVDAVLGAIPVIGSVFDFGFKANNRNITLLERHLDDPAGTRQQSGTSLRRTVVAVVAAVVAIFVLIAVAVIWGLSLLF